MSDDGPRNVAASVHARLRNVSRDTGEDFNLLLIRHALERFLYRLSRSKYRDQFVLKGAFLFVAWEHAVARPTRDMDFLAFGKPDISALERVFREICVTKVEPDGVVFDPKTVTGAEIREGAVYDGVRMKFISELGNARTRLQVDVGFGDAVVPPTEGLRYPTILDQEAPLLLGYPPEGVIAEKFHAMVTLGTANSRLKDYLDIWRICRTFTFQLPRVAAALNATFEHRNTEIPTGELEGLSQEFVERWAGQWARLSDRYALRGELPPLQEVIQEIRDFITPVLKEASSNKRSDKSWTATKGWHR